VIDLKNVQPAITSLIIGLSGAVLVVLQKLLSTEGADLSAGNILQVVGAAVVSYLLSYGIGLYHLNQEAPKQQ
jgi:uncharacterized membrane protein